MERVLRANEETAPNPDPFDLVGPDFVTPALVGLRDAWVLGGLADVERDLIRTGITEGRSRAKAQGKAQRALRCKNLPAATMSAYPPFAASPEPHDLLGYVFSTAIVNR
jgi:hypothetical protein